MAPTNEPTSTRRSISPPARAFAFRTDHTFKEREPLEAASLLYGVEPNKRGFLEFRSGLQQDLRATARSAYEGTQALLVNLQPIMLPPGFSPGGRKLSSYLYIDHSGQYREATGERGATESEPIHGNQVLVEGAALSAYTSEQFDDLEPMTKEHHGMFGKVKLG